jgi:hypothetical protein
MSNSNIVVFSDPRSGSSAFTELMKNTNDIYNQHIGMTDGHAEYLNCVPCFFPLDEHNKVQWNDTTDVLFNDNDYIGLQNYYLNNPVLDTVISMRPCIVNNIIEMESTPFNDTIKTLSDNFLQTELTRRVQLLKTASPYCFKYFNYHITNDDWINRDDTIVIVLVRNNILDKIASWKRQQISNIWHVFNDDNNTFQESDIIDKVPTSIVHKSVHSHHILIDRINKLKPDIIVSYEWLNEHGILNQTKYTKVNTLPTELFFEDYTTATDIVNKVQPIKQKNIELLMEILK